MGAVSHFDTRANRYRLAGDDREILPLWRADLAVDARGPETLARDRCGRAAAALLQHRRDLYAGPQRRDHRCPAGAADRNVAAAYFTAASAAGAGTGTGVKSAQPA